MEEKSEKIINSSLGLDIRVMERKIKHGTITPGEEILLKAWYKQRQNNAVTQPSKQQPSIPPAVSMVGLKNARFGNGENQNNYATRGRPKKSGEVHRSTIFRRKQKEQQPALF